MCAQKTTNTATNQIFFADARSVISDQNCVSNCPEGVTPSAFMRSSYTFHRTERKFYANDARMATANEFASTFLLKDNRLVSRYLELNDSGSYRINEVEVDIELDQELTITNFYSD